MEFSISSYCMFKQKPKDVLDELSKHTKHVEWMYEGYHSQVTPVLLKGYAFDYTVHAPFLGVNISEFPKNNQIQSWDKLISTIEFAKDIHARTIVIHPGIYYSKEFRMDAYAKMYQFIDKLVDYNRCCKNQLKIVIENVGNWDDFGINLLQSPDEIPHNVDFCLDIGHANLCGNLNEFLDTEFKHIHIHDNNGLYDHHLGAGEGNIDFESVAKAIKRNNIEHPVLECNTLERCLKTKQILEENYGL